MGKVLPLVEQHIPNGAQIACVIPTDHLIVCSVSNWGGYALAAALAAGLVAALAAALVAGSPGGSPGGSLGVRPGGRHPWPWRMPPGLSP